MLSRLQWCILLFVFPYLEACVGRCNREQISLNFCVQVFLFFRSYFLLIGILVILSFLYLNIKNSKRFRNCYNLANLFERIWEFPCFSNINFCRKQQAAMLDILYEIQHNLSNYCFFKMNLIHNVHPESKQNAFKGLVHVLISI